MREQWKKWVGELENYLGEKITSEHPWEFLDEFIEKFTEPVDLMFATIPEDLFLENGTVIRAPCRIEGVGYIGKNCVIGPFAYLRRSFVLGD